MSTTPEESTEFAEVVKIFRDLFRPPSETSPSPTPIPEIPRYPGKVRSFGVTET
jgi:hypothetical protein